MMQWYNSKKQLMEEVSFLLNIRHEKNLCFYFIDLERMPTIFNQLLTILKHIIEAYRLIDSIDVLEYAAKLIHLLQGKYLSLFIYL
jgi:hypothetical protein